MKTQLENPTGLHQKYYIQKISHITEVDSDNFDPKLFQHQSFLEPLDDGFEGFVLRLDKGGDPKHVEACRKAVLKYAEEIKDYLPELSKDLLDKYER